jgi:uncharacterized membrane protein SpoIIM required for sporulation/ABC-type transport system involved in multi-copper enzyme maturation permease subunit
MSVQSNVLPSYIETITVKKSRSSLSRALIVTRRELRDTLRDWRIVSPIVTLVLVIPFLLAAILQSTSANLIKEIGRATFYDKLLPFTTLAVGFLPMSFCLVIALETFVGEKERNSLEALLSAPLTDFELFMGKYLAAITPTVAASTSASLMFGLLVTLFGQPFPVPFDLLLVFLGLNIVQGLVMVAGSVLVSTHTTSVRAANIMASFIILPMSLAVQLEAILILNNLRSILYFLLLALIVMLLMLLRSGVKIFNREEIVAREGDNVSLKGILRGFGYYFKRTPREALANQKTGARWTPWRLYRHDIPQIIALNKGASIMIAVCLLGAVGLGFWIGNWQEASQLTGGLGMQIQAKGQDIPICQEGVLASNGITWQWIFMNNARSVLVGGVVAMFTLGVGGIGMLMVSVGPLGFIANLLAKLSVNPLPYLVGFLLPHGIIELPAAILGIAVGMRVGISIITPPPGLSIGQSLQFAIVNYFKMLTLIVPLLLIAAIIEANVTPGIGCWITGGKL